MSKKQALDEFKREILPYVIGRYGRNDRVAISEAWCEYTDMLREDRRITPHQDATWTNPF